MNSSVYDSKSDYGIGIPIATQTHLSGFGSQYGSKTHFGDKNKSLAPIGSTKQIFAVQSQHQTGHQKGSMKGIIPDLEERIECNN